MSEPCWAEAAAEAIGYIAAAFAFSIWWIGRWPWDRRKR